MFGVPWRDDSPPFATPPVSCRARARPRRVCRSPSARVITGDAQTLRWDLTRKLKGELEAGGCNIPFPQTDVHAIDMPAR